MIVVYVLGATQVLKASMMRVNHLQMKIIMVYGMKVRNLLMVLFLIINKIVLAPVMAMHFLMIVVSV